MKWPLLGSLAILLATAPAPAEATVTRLVVLHERFLVTLAYQMGLVLACLVVLLMLGIFGMRLGLVLAAHRERRFLAVWRPRLLKYMVGERMKIPALSRGDRLLLFRLWSHMHESVRGTARDRLNDFARRVDLDRIAWNYARSRRPRRALLGLLALGSLQEGKAWPLFKAQLESASPVHSLAALRGILAIDEARAMPLVVEAIGTRSDWSPVRVASFLKEASPEVLGRSMGDAIGQVPPEQAIRLLKYLNAINCFQAMPHVRRLAARTKDAGVLSACLAMLRGPQDVAFIRRHLSHPMWFVRVQAATALGKIGRPGDEERLQGLLSDQNWWVRYRAAQAISTLPFLPSTHMRDLQHSHLDAYARDILSQVLAEAPLA